MTSLKTLIAAALVAGASTAAFAQSENGADLYGTAGKAATVQTFEGRTVIIEGRNAVEAAPVYQVAPVAGDIVVDPARAPN
jgi:hypothetical protein